MSALELNRGKSVDDGVVHDPGLGTSFLLHCLALFLGVLFVGHGTQIRRAEFHLMGGKVKLTSTWYFMRMTKAKSMW